MNCTHANSAPDANRHNAPSAGSAEEDVAPANRYLTNVTDQFNAVSYLGDSGIPSHDAAAQYLGDPMDLDFDLEVALWAGELDPAMDYHESNMAIDYGPPMNSTPADFLFAEDEGVLPATSSYDAQFSQSSHPIDIPQPPPAPPSPTRTVFSASRSDAGSDDAKSLEDGSPNGLARQRLRRQLSLLSKGWAGDEIRFKNCDPSKAVVLHTLAMELGLGYNHDVRSREVSMSRLEPAQAPSKPRPSPRRLSSSFSRSSTELDSALCLPGLPVVLEHQTFDIAAHFSHEPDSESAQPEPGNEDQPLVRRPSRSERISDSIREHVSTLKTSMSKGGRRGPLSENGRRDMRALEAVGGGKSTCVQTTASERKGNPPLTIQCVQPAGVVKSFVEK